MGLAICACSFLSAAVLADGSGDPAAVKEANGEWYDKEGNPTYHIGPDNEWDWYTYTGYLRYNGICIVCHGPDGGGSSFAPSLVDALKTLSYGQFIATVAQGIKNVSASSDLVMPSFANNKNVMCYLDNIYVYLRARSGGTLGPVRPDKHVPKPAAVSKAEDECMGPL
ncbi:MAG: c-type cytochrome, methanol metabolism-related [Rhodomicrobium sp.]